MINSHEWINVIMRRLFEPETRRVNRMVQQLTERNSDMKGLHTLGFMHLGEVHIPESYKDVYRMTPSHLKSKATPPLAFELLTDVGAFMADVNKLNLDKAQIKQVLFKLVVNASNHQELRDSLPESLIAIMPELKDYNRQLENPVFFIQSDWRAVRDYERMLPKIDMYAMTRLIY